MRLIYNGAIATNESTLGGGEGGLNVGNWGGNTLHYVPRPPAQTSAQDDGDDSTRGNEGTGDEEEDGEEEEDDDVPQLVKREPPRENEGGGGGHLQLEQGRGARPLRVRQVEGGGEGDRGGEGVGTGTLARGSLGRSTLVRSRVGGGEEGPWPRGR